MQAPTCRSTLASSHMLSLMRNSKSAHMAATRPSAIMCSLKLSSYGGGSETMTKTKQGDEAGERAIEPDEPIPFDDALRILLAAPPQHKVKPKGDEKPRPKRARGK